METLLQQTLLIALAVVALGLVWFGKSRARGLRLRLDDQGRASAAGLAQEGEQDCYLLDARAGAHLVIDLERGPGSAVCHVLAPGGRAAPLPGDPRQTPGTSWRGRLPLTGTYRIIVRPTPGPAHYTLRVRLRPFSRPDTRSTGAGPTRSRLAPGPSARATGRRWD